jgi:hypothetical protein
MKNQKKSGPRAQTTESGQQNPGHGPGQGPKNENLRLLAKRAATES